MSNPLGECEAAAIDVIGNLIRVIGTCAFGRNGESAEDTGGDLVSLGFKGTSGEDEGLGIFRCLVLVIDAELARVQELRRAAIVDRLSEGFEALEATFPNPIVLLSDLELAFFGFIETDVAGRFFVVGEFLAGVEIEVFFPILGIPLLGGCLDFFLESDCFAVGEVI